MEAIFQIKAYQLSLHTCTCCCDTITTTPIKVFKVTQHVLTPQTNNYIQSDALDWFWSTNTKHYLSKLIIYIETCKALKCFQQITTTVKKLNLPVEKGSRFAPEEKDCDEKQQDVRHKRQEIIASSFKEKPQNRRRT